MFDYLYKLFLLKIMANNQCFGKFYYIWQFFFPIKIKSDYFFYLNTKYRSVMNQKRYIKKKFFKLELDTAVNQP